MDANAGLNGTNEANDGETQDQISVLTQQISALKAEVQKLTRENKILKITVGELERVIDRDTLTPVFNRRYFVNQLIKRKKQLIEDGSAPVALLYLDVDGLKHINDAHGHAAGDFALIEMARRLTEQAEGTDLVARVGGDEFAVLIDNLEEAQAQSKAAAIRSAVSGKTDYNGVPIDLRASIGCIAITSHENEEDLLVRADQAMLEARHLAATTPA